MMFRCLMQGLRAFRLAVVVQMSAGCTQAMPLASLSGRGVPAKIKRWSLSFFCVRVFRRATVVLERAHGDELGVVAGICQLSC